MAKKKKSAKKVVKKKKYSITKVFKCLFCNHDKSVECKMNFKAMVGQLYCSICESKFESKINPLSDAVDVYTKWLDETSNAQSRAVESNHKLESMSDEEEPAAMESSGLYDEDD